MEMEYMVNESDLLEVKADGKKEVYDLSKPIKETSLVVQNEKRNILHRMDLPTVIANVDNAVDLLDVSYHAVYGFPVQSRLYGLQKQLMDLNDTGIIVITGFKRKVTLAITELASMYKWLLKGAEVVALGKLNAFSDMAADMAEQANKMADGYQGLADVTSSVLEDVIKENAKQYEKSDHLKQMMAECEAEESNAAALRESLEKRIKALNKEYGRMVKQEEAAEKHKNTMEIMSAVFGFLGKAIDVAGSAAAGRGNTASNKEMSNDDIKGQEKELKDKKGKIEADLEKAKEEKATLQKELEEKIRKKDETEKTEDKEELEKEISGCRENIRKKGEEIDQLEKDKQSAESMLGKIGSLLSGAGSQMAQEAQESASADAARAERMNAIYEEMLRLEEENTKQVGLLAKYAKQMESFVVDQKSIDAAIQALIIATSSLKRAVVAFKDIALFWNSLEESCRALSESTFKNTIKDLQELPKEDRISFYKDVDIMYPLLCYIAQWTAVASVSADYLDAAEKTRTHLNETLVTADSTDMTRQQHWDKASSLAGKVGDRLQEQVTEGKQKIKNLTEKKAAQ